MTTVTLGIQSKARNVNLRDIAVESSKRGLPEGIKQENIERCIQILEHTGGCRNTSSCTEGESCFRTKQVLVHYRNCPKREKCSICQQLVALCQIHAQRCQGHLLSCHVPHCVNKKEPQKTSKEDPMKAKNSTLEPTNEEYKTVMTKLIKALRMPSLAEKRSIIHQLFTGNPQVTTKLLRELCKAKLLNGVTNQRKPVRQFIRQPTCGQSAHLLAMKKQDVGLNGKNITGSPPVSWNAKISFIPIQ